MIFTNSDGGARGNPGPAAIGVTVRDGEKILEEDSKVLERPTTNNVAEYKALIRALELASKQKDILKFLVRISLPHHLKSKHSLLSLKILFPLLS